MTYRFPVALLCFLLYATVISAGHRILSTKDGYPKIELQLVEDTDSSTLVYMTYTKDNDSNIASICLNRNTHVTVKGLSYKVLSTFNLPILDEADRRYAYLTEPGQKHNIIVEFEKFPYSEEFDIIENESSATAFNFHGISVDVASDTDIDSQRFIDSTPMTVLEKYTVDGNSYCTIVHDNVAVTFLFESYGDKAFTVRLGVDNDSDHGILLDRDRISVVCDIRKGKNIEQKEYAILSRSEYNDYLAENDYYTAQNESGSRGLSQLSSDIRSSSYAYRYDSAERIGLNLLSALVAEANEKKMEPQLKEPLHLKCERVK